MKILVTGAAGFIGSKVSSLLSNRGDDVVGIDNLNDSYDVALKKARLTAFGGPHFERLDICDAGALEALFAREGFDAVVALAAQAGVRHSTVTPQTYVQSNICGFFNILEACRKYAVKHLVFASSSSVYGEAESAPFCEQQNTDYPVSLYAATKKSGELLAYSYAQLYHLPITALRYFTVYGPWGRPDMAPILFADAICEGRPISLFGEGKQERDFTYIDDIAEGTIAVLDAPPIQKDLASSVPYRVMNIGNGRPIGLCAFVEELEKALGMKAEKRLLPMQPGDVTRTWADTTQLEQSLGFRPRVSLQQGVAEFVKWYKEYYKR